MINIIINKAQGLS